MSVNQHIDEKLAFEKQKTEPIIIDNRMWFQDYRFHSKGVNTNT